MRNGLDYNRGSVEKDENNYDGRKLSFCIKSAISKIIVFKYGVLVSRHALFLYSR